MTPCAVLHFASLLGGGVDRHIRDIARSIPGEHIVWHAGEAADVIEIPAERRALPLDRGRLQAHPGPLAAWLRARGVGIVHAHTLSRAARRRLEWVSEALALPMVATLHDVTFLSGSALHEIDEPLADPAWLAEVAPLLGEAKAVLAPSEYLARLAERNVEGLAVERVPNGSPRHAASEREAAQAEFVRERPARIAAVLGAIGPHKGSNVLDQVATALVGTDIAIVVIGYLEKRLRPGWHVPGRLFVHGAYDDAQVPALLEAYGAEVALFPNRVPESFSYALSDLWSAGLPAIVPASGALAERVRRHGCGWILPERAGAAEIAAELRRVFSDVGADDLARVRSQLSRPDAGRVPTLEDMARTLEALYRRFGLVAGAPVEPESPELQDLLATNLDGSLFRPELRRMAGELAHVEGQLAAEREAARRFEGEARPWIAKLEEDVKSLQADLTREVDARRRSEEEAGRLRIDKAAFDSLPGFVRRWLLRRTQNARS